MSGARTHCARCSIASSMPSSAQWMSSKAITNGRRRAIASIRAAAPRGTPRASARGRPPPARARRARRRRAAGRSARPRGPSVVARRAHQLADVRRAASARPPRRSPSRRCRTRRAAPRRAPRRRCRSRRGGSGPCEPSAPTGAARAARSNSRSRRDLPTPASPISVTRCGRALAHHALVERCRARRAPGRGRPAATRSPAPRGAAACSAIRPTASQAGTRLGLALQLERLELLVLDGGVGGAHRALAHRDAAGPRRRSGAGRRRSRCRR